MAAKLSIHNEKGKATEEMELPEKIFSAAVNTDLLHQATVCYQACLRQGTASTKERGAVSGGGIKPYRQKGTGRARAGSIRSPLWKGGGTVFGPHPRDFRYAIPRKMKKAALGESLNAKFQSQSLWCLDDLKEKFSKTKEFAKILTTLNLQGTILALLDGCDKSVFLASRNIARFEVRRCEDVNAYDILRHRHLLVTKTALKKLLKRVEPS